jgi:DNA-binding response OmpR family regulator
MLRGVVPMQNPEPPVTIVVVDEYPDGRDLMTTILRSEGFEVKEAGSGTEALALAAEQPALMVLDVNLPDLDGFEVCRRLKNDPHTAGVAVLQVSAAYRDSGDRVRGLQGGADAYLTLPIDRAEIVATVRALLRMQQMERESTALRAVTQLASAAAHEINNPLSVITGQLHFLARDAGVPQTRVTQMQEAADRIRDIVRQMLQMTRVEVLAKADVVPDMLERHRASLYRSA